MAQRTKTVTAAAVVGLLGLAGVAGAFALAAYHDDLTVREVATLAQQEPVVAGSAASRLTVDGVGFPDWSRWGWTATGGRTDDRSGRDVTSVVYENGGKTIRYSIVAGSDPVNWDFAGRPVHRTPPEGKVELLVSSVDPSSTVEIPGDCGDGPCAATSGDAITVTRKINDRTVVLTATPATDAVSQEAQDMALRTER